MQVQGEYEAKEKTMVAYLERVRQLIVGFEQFQLHQVPRAENGRADALAKFASSITGVSSRKVVVLTADEPEIESEKDSIGVCPMAGLVLKISCSETWMEDIKSYLLQGHLPDDPLEAKRLRVKASHFCILHGNLYKKSVIGIMLKCLAPERVAYVMQEIHEGCCRNHSGGRSLALKVMRQGYFWPTLVQDAVEFVKKCEKCL